MVRGLSCLLGKHRPDEQVDWDDGYFTSRCSNCRTELTRSQHGPWRAVARSMRPR